ncbi:XkdX family protein [Staphylococcus caprae]
MYVTLKNLYIMKLFTKEKLAETVKYNWINADQYKEITGEEYKRPQV